MLLRARLSSARWGRGARAGVGTCRGIGLYFDSVLFWFIFCRFCRIMFGLVVLFVHVHLNEVVVIQVEHSEVLQTRESARVHISDSVLERVLTRVASKIIRWLTHLTWQSWCGWWDTWPRSNSSTLTRSVKTLAPSSSMKFFLKERIVIVFRPSNVPLETCELMYGDVLYEVWLFFNSLK